MSVEIVIPTSGRPSLGRLLDALAGVAEHVVVVDDRPQPTGALRFRDPRKARVLQQLPVPTGVRVVRGPARGPAAARNAGWRACSAAWIAFLDDDVEPERGWVTRLESDLAAADADVAGVQGRVVVPLPADRRPTDWERSTRGLETARWATADLAYRREVLEAVGGFDECFPRAYREDADLGLRVTEAGWRIELGERVVFHPVRPATPWISVAKQAGNADDARMRALHGRDWRSRAGVPPGRRPRHLAIAGSAAVAAGALLAGHRRVAALAGVAWAAGTAELAWARIAPGPRTPAELATMAWTSAAIPFAATAWWLAAQPSTTLRKGPGTFGSQPSTSLRKGPGTFGSQPSTSLRKGSGTFGSQPSTTLRKGSGTFGSQPSTTLRKGPGTFGGVEAVLFDRDGTLVVDVPYNGDPERVVAMPGARSALARLRAAGVPTGVVSNQSGIARGLLTERQARAVNARVEALLGPLGPWAWCPHGPDDGCACRKPAPGLILQVAAELGVDPARCVVVGDIGADVESARAAGAQAILVPTPITRAEEIAAAPEVAPDLAAAVDRILADRPAPRHRGGAPRDDAEVAA